MINSVIKALSKSRAKFSKIVKILSKNNISWISKINKINPDDKVTEIFINRCKKIIKEGWDPDLWDGVNRLRNK